jgi:hypothetical protein
MRSCAGLLRGVLRDGIAFLSTMQIYKLLSTAVRGAKRPWRKLKDRQGHKKESRSGRIGSIL